MKKHLILSVALLVAGFASSGSAVAGGGPENVLLVVNPKSPSSLCIANHFAKLRQIPPDNLFFLPWEPAVQSTDIDTFRQKILIPLLEMMKNRHLTEQVDYVVYSSDFPTAINLESDVRKFIEVMQRMQNQQNETSKKPSDPDKPPQKLEWPKNLTPVGSITGLTYLWQPVAAALPLYFPLQSNNYFRRPIPGQREAQPTGFRSNRLYDGHGRVVEQKGQRYILSMMLGVTAGRGNSNGEIISYLRRSASVDGTHPKGTIYLVKNDDVRSTVRDKSFPIVVEALKQLGVAAEIIEGTVPLNKKDVQGVVMGTRDFDWKSSGSTILPGAICDNFTSFGGVMIKGSEQTPLTEFLRFGAAGASGAVTEPYSIINKFPSPICQIHYVRGCSLAESFYQSVYGPYQLLIVGDPLCQPWADIPEVSVAGIESGATVKGELKLKPSATLPKTALDAQAIVNAKASQTVRTKDAKDSKAPTIDHFEMFIDGLRASVCQPGQALSLDTAVLADGHHELRVVAIGPEPIETQGRKIFPFQTANYGRKIEATLVTKPPLQAEKPVSISVNSPGSSTVIVLHGSRVVGSIKGEKGNIDVAPNTLGVGPVLLRVVGIGGGGLKTNVWAKPLELTVQ